MATVSRTFRHRRLASDNARSDAWELTVLTFLNPCTGGIYSYFSKGFLDSRSPTKKTGRHCVCRVLTSARAGFCRISPSVRISIAKKPNGGGGSPYSNNSDRTWRASSVAGQLAAAEFRRRSSGRGLVVVRRLSARLRYVLLSTTPRRPCITSILDFFISLPELEKSLFSVPFFRARKAFWAVAGRIAHAGVEKCAAALPFDRPSRRGRPPQAPVLPPIDTAFARFLPAFRRRSQVSAGCRVPA